ncbi:MAG TPA: hypothetical protein PLD59_03925 [Tepidisphaeraceae bacterium]|nr:hypothetical protein [Tepidisphaeraceae bacterium]
MTVSPVALLFTVLLLTGLAVGGYAVADFRRHRRLRAMAAALEMHFAANDRFDLAATVARRFPVVAPADPLITDLIYCRRDRRYLYVFRFDYTIGVTGPKRRRRAIVGFSEPCDAPGEPSSLYIDKSSDPLEQRYRSLVEKCNPTFVAA